MPVLSRVEGPSGAAPRIAQTPGYQPAARPRRQHSSLTPSGLRTHRCLETRKDRASTTGLPGEQGWRRLFGQCLGRSLSGAAFQGACAERRSDEPANVARRKGHGVRGIAAAPLATPFFCARRALPATDRLLLPKSPPRGQSSFHRGSRLPRFSSLPLESSCAHCC